MKQGLLFVVLFCSREQNFFLFGSLILQQKLIPYSTQQFKTEAVLGDKEGDVKVAFLLEQLYYGRGNKEFKDTSKNKIHS